MKKKTSLLLAILLLASLIQSCGGNTAADETTPSSETSTDTVSTAAESEIAGVIPVKWNQSASTKMASKSNSCSVAVEIEE